MASRKSAKTTSKTKSKSSAASAPKKSAPVKAAPKAAKSAKPAKAKPAAPKAKPVKAAKAAPKTKPAKVVPKAKPAPKAKPTKTVVAVAKIVKAAQAVAKTVTETVKEAKDVLAPKKPSKKAPAAKPKAQEDDAPAEPAPPAAGISVGDRAPSFSLKDQNGETVSSASLAGKPYVLYFYPKDDTPGCTKEACGFRDSFAGFGKKTARILGVSPDTQASHAKFAGKYGLPFTLLSDLDKSLSQAYGVWQLKKNYGKEYMGIQRSTFVVDAKGIVTHVYRNVRVDGHVDAVLSAVGAL